MRIEVVLSDNLNAAFPLADNPEMKTHWCPLVPAGIAQRLYGYSVMALREFGQQSSYDGQLCFWGAHHQVIEDSTTMGHLERICCVHQYVCDDSVIYL